MEYFEKVAAYEDDILYDLAEDEAYDLAYEKTAATRFKELMNEGSLSKKSVGRLNDLGYLNPISRRHTSTNYMNDHSGLARNYVKTLSGKRIPIVETKRGVSPDGNVVIHRGTIGAIKGGKPSWRAQRYEALKAAKNRNTEKVVGRWGREMANANGGHLNLELQSQLADRAEKAFGPGGYLSAFNL